MRSKVQGLIEISDQIIRRLYADREPHKSIANSSRQPLFARHGAMAGGCGMHNKRASVPQASRSRKNLDAIHHLLASIQSSFNLKAHHRAKSFHLPAGKLVAWVRGQPRVVDAVHLRVRGQELRDTLRARALRWHAQMQSVNAAQNKPCVERANHASEIADNLSAKVSDVIFRAHDNASHGIPVTAEVFGGRMHHHGHAERDWLLQHGRGKGIVDHQWKLARPRKRGEAGNIQDIEHWVAGGFKIDQPRVWPDGALKVLNAR